MGTVAEFELLSWEGKKWKVAEFENSTQKLIFHANSRACLQRDSYWGKRGIPGPRGDVIMGNLRALFDYDYPNVFQLRDWTKQFGKTYGIREGWRHVLVTSDPEIVQEFLVKKFDNFHGRKVR